jgi:hypothetical protein
MHNPEKKDRTISAIAEGAILGFSAPIFIARRRCSSCYRFLVRAQVSLLSLLLEPVWWWARPV